MSGRPKLTPAERRKLFEQKDENAIIRVLGPHNFRHPKDIQKLTGRPFPYADVLVALRRLQKADLVLRGPLPRSGFGYRLTVAGAERHAFLKGMDERESGSKGRTARRRRKRSIRSPAQQ